MVWLALALIAVLLAGWFAFTRGQHPLALVLLAVTFGLVFVIGRRIEGQRDADWEKAATRLHARFLAAPGLAYLRSFGPGAPWDAWAAGGQLQCPRAIDGSAASRPFALVHVRYAVHEPRGEETPEQWRDAVVAIVRRPAGPSAAPGQPLDAGPGYEAASNGEWLFVWKKPQPGALVPAALDELNELLQQALRTQQRAAGSGATPP